MLRSRLSPLLLLLACTGVSPAPPEVSKPEETGEDSVVAVPIEQISLELGDAAAGEPARCRVETEGAHLVAWTVDGRLLSTGASLPMTEVMPGDTLVCTATTATHQASASAVVPGLPGNVLVLLADDLGVDQLAAYGEHPSPPVTPRIDQLAAEGVLFERAYASSVCSPSRGSLLTGRQPSRFGIGWWLDLRGDSWSLPDGELTLAEMLRLAPAGRWTSVALGKWHLVSAGHPDPGRHPLEQGFAHHRGPLANPAMSLGRDPHPRSYLHWEKFIDGDSAWEETYLTTDTVNDAIEQVQTLPEPWLLWVAFNAPHSPFHVPPADLFHTPVPPQASQAERYRAMVEALDTEIGRLLDAMEPELRQRTTIIFMSDNGSPSEAITAPFAPVRSKHTLYDGGIRVPLIVTGPHVSEPGRRTDALVHAVDLFPTIAALAGVDTATLAAGSDPTGQTPLELDGTSLLPLLQDPSHEPTRTWLMVEQFSDPGPPPWPDHRRAIVESTYKRIENLERPDHFFDYRSSDVDEGENLSNTGLEGERLEARLRLGDRLDQLDGASPFRW